MENLLSPTKDDTKSTMLTYRDLKGGLLKNEKDNN